MRGKESDKNETFMVLEKGEDVLLEKVNSEKRVVENV